MADQRSLHNQSQNQNPNNQSRAHNSSKLSNRPSLRNTKNGNNHSQSGKILRTDQETKQTEQTRQLFRLAQCEIDELKDSLRYAEYVLARTKEEKEQLEKQVSDDRQTVKEAKFELQSKNQELGQAHRQTEAMLRQTEHAQISQNKVSEQARHKLQQLQDEINRREGEIQELSKSIQDKDSHLSKITVTEQINRNENKEYRDQLAKKDKLISDLQRELEQTRKTLDEVVMTRKSEGTALLEIQHYKADNERLVAMLSQTKEFENFGRLAADSVSDGGVGIRFMNPDRQPEGTCHYPKKQSKLKDFYKDSNECEDWIPDEAFKLAHDFRNKCASSISQSLMNQLLQDLNKVWRQREKKQVQKIQNKSNKEIAFLRRQISFKQPYDKVLLETDIKRLKKEVKDNQQALRENVAIIKESNDAPLNGLVLVDQTVKYTNQIQKERRHLLDENERLQNRIEELEKSTQDEANEREKFYEGATWLGKQVLEECDRGVHSISTVLKRDYHQKLQESGKDLFLRDRVNEWLMDSSERVVKEVREKNAEIVEAALRNKVAAKSLNAYR
eukprot:403376845